MVIKKDSDRQPGKRRWVRLFRTILLCMGLSYLLAMPILGVSIDDDLERNGDEICLRNDTDGPGVSYRSEGMWVCKIMFTRVLFASSFLAAWVSPIAVFLVYMLWHVRRIRQLAPGVRATSKARMWWEFVRNIGLSILLVFTAGGAWIALRLLEDLPAARPHLCNKSTPGQEWWTYNLGGGRTAYCTLNFDAVFDELWIWSPMLLPVVALVMYGIHLWRTRRRNGIVDQPVGRV